MSGGNMDALGVEHWFSMPQIASLSLLWASRLLLFVRRAPRPFFASGIRTTISSRNGVFAKPFILSEGELSPRIRAEWLPLKDRCRSE